jgi:phage-related baseplate assembly protein
MATLPEPVFFDTDEQGIIAEMTAYYESLVGKKLAPSQSETLLINAFAYREKILRIAGNEAAKQMLIDFAIYPALDYLGGLLNVDRLDATTASCSIVFSMVPGNPMLIIPAGVRIQSTDGKVVFVTLQDITVPANTATVTTIAECTTEGAAGNNYQPGDIAIILDPQAFVTSAANSDTTGGGTDQENDEAYRERIRLAPSSFSVAGPEDAYKFFAKSANPAIIDIAITSPLPLHVNIYPLMEGGVAPSDGVIAQINAACNPERVRPLNDIVTVAAPTAINYEIEVELTTLTSAIDATVLAQVNANIAAYAKQRQTKLGIDVVKTQIIGKCMVDQVYECNVISPATDLVIAPNEFGNCTGINITITGQVDA